MWKFSNFFRFFRRRKAQFPSQRMRPKGPTHGGGKHYCFHSSSLLHCYYTSMGLWVLKKINESLCVRWFPIGSFESKSYPIFHLAPLSSFSLLLKLSWKADGKNKAGKGILLIININIGSDQNPIHPSQAITLSSVSLLSVFIFLYWIQ